MKTRKTATAAAIAILAGLGLAACSGGSGGEASASGSTNADITWNMWAGSDDDQKWVDQTAEIVRKQNPDISLETQTSAWADYFTKLTANASSGNLACITSMNGQRLSGFYKALSPLSDEDLEKAGIDKSAFADGALDILSHDGKVYGVPYDVAAMLVFYNRDMLAETGTPEPAADWTFDDFLATAKSATTDAHKGFAVGMGEFQWMSLPIAKSGVQPVDGSGALALTDPAFTSAAEWYASLVTKEKVADPVPSASELGWGEDQYSNGNVAMAVDGTWNAAGYFTNEAGFKAGATRLPKGDKGSLGLVLGSGYGIAANCQGADRDAALKVLGSLVSKEAQDLIGSTGRSFPALKASQPAYFDSLDESIRDDVKKAFDAAFNGTVGQNSISTWTQVNEYLTPNLVSVYTGATTMTDVLAQAQSQFGKN